MKPNIILITADQHRADAIGAENSNIHTPTLDALSASGCRFTACITPNLVCQPSRASMLTGLMPLTHGVRDNGIDLPAATGENGFAASLARQGYQTSFFGKAHFSTKSTFVPTGTPEDRASGPLYEEGWMGPYMGFAHTELTVLGHFHKSRPPVRPVVGHWERWFLARGTDEEALAKWAQSSRPGTGAAQTWASALPEQWHSSTWIADRAIDWIGQRASEEPFCTWISFPDPHHPFDCPSPWNSLHKPADMVLPRHRVRDLDSRPWWHKASLEGKPQLRDPEMLKFREEGSRVPPQTDEMLAEMMANYYGMISLVDHNVGRIIAKLESSGLLSNTYIVYTSDHGELMGNHGLYLKGPTPYEDLLRVPMIINGPGVVGGSTVDQPVSTLDLAATFGEWSGGGVPPDSQGQSLAALCTGTEANPRKAAYSEWYVNASRCGVELQLHTVRTRTAKLTVELLSGAGEMYDLAADPHEMTNVFDHPDYSQLRSELQALLDQRPRVDAPPVLVPIGMA